MLHQRKSIIGLTLPSMPAIAILTNHSATAKSQAIWGDFRCMVPLTWHKPHIMMLHHPSGTYIKYVASTEINYWAHMTLITNYRHTY